MACSRDLNFAVQFLHEAYWQDERWNLRELVLPE